jgi:hypothetical protein
LEINKELREAYIEYRFKWRKQLRSLFDVITILGYINWGHYQQATGLSGTLASLLSLYELYGTDTVG